MNDDKVTLEWLMRLDIPSPPKEGYGDRSDPTWSFGLGNGIMARIEVFGYDRDPDLTIFKWDDPWKEEFVYIRCPTIARFHEAVAFLGATLPPLKEGV